MTPLEIKIAIIRAGSSMAEIGRCKEGSPVNRSTVYRVIHRLSVSDPVARAVAEVIGKPVGEVFPERYSVPGKAA